MVGGVSVGGCKIVVMYKGGGRYSGRDWARLCTRCTPGSPPRVVEQEQKETRYHVSIGSRKTTYIDSAFNLSIEIVT